MDHVPFFSDSLFFDGAVGDGIFFPPLQTLFTRMSSPLVEVNVFFPGRSGSRRHNFSCDNPRRLSGGLSYERRPLPRTVQSAESVFRSRSAGDFFLGINAGGGVDLVFFFQGARFRSCPELAELIFPSVWAKESLTR